MGYQFSGALEELRDTAAAIAQETLAPRDEEIDRDARWPREGFEALKSAGLLGLHAPQAMGGHQQGLLALAVTCEALAQGCPAAAICFGMHCVGTAVIVAKATPSQRERYLRPIAEGRHITTIALSEAGTGSHFYIPETLLERKGDHFVVTGQKHFVTNGANADSYVLSTRASTPEAEAGEFSCIVVDAKTPRAAWGEPWAGFGMRGNEARSLTLAGASVPVENLLGNEGDQTWYVFEVVAPYFLVAMAGVYLGIAQAAFDITLNHLRSRTFTHSGETLAESPVLQTRVAELWTTIERTRLLIYEAARLGDSGDPAALLALLASKAEVAETAVRVTNDAMTLCGGIAYAENGKLSRLLRDARASHVMAPTTDVLKLWAGRTLLDLPML